MTPIDVMTVAVVEAWRGLCVMGEQASHLSTATTGERVAFGFEVAALALVITSIGVVVAEVVRVVRLVGRHAPLVWLTVLTQPVESLTVVLVVIALGLIGLWHWWGSIAATAVGVAALVVVTDQTMQADLSEAATTDEGEDE